MIARVRRWKIRRTVIRQLNAGALLIRIPKRRLTVADAEDIMRLVATRNE